MPIRRVGAPPAPPSLKPAQAVTLDVPVQPTSQEDVYLRGSGPGWVDPEVARAHRGANVSLYTGPLFRDEPTFGDVQQGQLGDCYLCAALAGIAVANPEAIKNLIKPGDDGSAIVTFYERDVITGQFQPVTLRVDAELAESRSGNKPIYGHAKGDRASMELWFPLVEKAYATWKGGYEAVGLGGVQNQIFEAVLGRPAGWLAVSETSDVESVWGTIQATLDAKLPLGAATHSTDDGRYANTGVHANHGYSVLRTETEGNDRFVVLRNPWGSGEPRGDGVDDGVFRLPLQDFVKLYGQLQFTLL
jgi:hypothetical protein